MSNSYYDFGPGENGTLDTFDAEMLELIARAQALGLTGVQFGIDEVKRFIQSKFFSPLFCKTIENFQCCYMSFIW